MFTGKALSRIETASSKDELIQLEAQILKPGRLSVPSHKEGEVREAFAAKRIRLSTRNPEPETQTPLQQYKARILSLWGNRNALAELRVEIVNGRLSAPERQELVRLITQASG